MKSTIRFAFLFALLAVSASAESAGNSKEAVHTALNSLLFFACALVTLVAGFKIIDFVTPGELFVEIGLKGNLALSILAGGAVIAQGLVVVGAFGTNPYAEESALFPLVVHLPTNLILNSFIWSLGGSVLCAVCYKALDLATPGCSFEEQLVANQNKGLGLFLGCCCIAVGAVLGTIIRG